MMKGKALLFLLAAGTLSLAGCQKTGLFGEGDRAIRFSATAVPNNTKTMYGIYDADEPEDATWQSIDWVDGNAIRIYSDNAVRRVGYESGDENLYHWADYEIYGSNAGTADGTIESNGWSTAKLRNLSIDIPDGYEDTPYYDSTQADYEVGNGLMWPANSGEATFYALYPKPVPATNQADEGKGMVSGASGKFKGLYISNNQGFSKGGNLDLYGFMTATAKAAQPSNDAASNIPLYFYPAFTAFEISIRSAGAPIELYSFRLVSEISGQALAGNFDIDYSKEDIYDCTSANQSTISVDLVNQIAPGVDSEDKDLVFTVLATPQDFEQLRVEFTKAGTQEGAPGDTRKLALKYSATADGKGHTPGEYIKFGKCRKHRIYGLFLPNGELLISVGTEPWAAGNYLEFRTIENITSGFTSVQRYDEDETYDEGSWEIPGTYIGIAKGIEGKIQVDPEIPIDDDDPSTYIITKRPLHAPMFSMETVSVGVDLQLQSTNPNFKFVVPNGDGTYSEPKTTLPIRASDDITDKIITDYIVVAEDAEIGEKTEIRLIRMDNGVPVAYSHSELPGSRDHTRVPFYLLSEEDYLTKTVKLEPKI